jgi:hypothetical protein
MPVGSEENIVRAICTDKWDGEHISPSLFKGQNISVSRLALIPLGDHWDLFRNHVQKPPERLLALIGEINVGELHRVGKQHELPAEITVEPDPLDWNHAHAVIPQKISRGLATRIVRALKIHRESEQDS